MFSCIQHWTPQNNSSFHTIVRCGKCLVDGMMASIALTRFHFDRNHPAGCTFNNEIKLTNRIILK